MNSQRWTFPAIVSFFVLIFSAIAPAYVVRYRLPFASAAAIYSCFLLMIMMAIAPGLPASREWIRRHLPQHATAVALALVWALPYAIYAAGTGDLQPNALLRLLVIGAVVPGLYTLFPVRDLSRFTWQDFGVAVWLIGSLLSRQLSHIWNVPVNLDFLGRLFLIVVGSWTWVYVRPVPRLSFELFPTDRTFRAASVNFLLFAVFAIPAGLLLHFIAWNPRWTSLWGFAVSYLEISLFIALLEELFFRGFLQTLLAGTFASDRRALVLVSCLFGLFHILHAPFPNWRYVALATVAGWFYGSAFLEGRSLLASALTHAMVDTVWRTFFTASPR